MPTSSDTQPNKRTNRIAKSIDFLGHMQAHLLSHHTSLPDLRFLNHNKPAPTAASILDPHSKNATNEQQALALKKAEAWYKVTANMLRERLVLCERLREGLGEVNALLARIDGSTRQEEALAKDTSERESVEYDDVATIVDPGTMTGRDSRDLSTVVVAGGEGPELKVMEEALQIWLKDVRVARAKWNAAGRMVEKRTGMR